tara:strand:+ start:375 stop:1085 length:711 start_codon:yes stop_codon:yes gene_type:complete
MPTTTINATLQGKVEYETNIASTNWTGLIRDVSTGTNADTYTTQIGVGSAIKVGLFTARTNYVGELHRVFLFFDNLDTNIVGTITATTLKVYNASVFSNNTHTIAVEGSAWGNNGTTTTLSTSDYSNLDHSTAYSSENTTWNGGTGVYNDFVLNSTAITAMNTNGYLNVAIIEGEYDYGNTNPTLDVTGISTAIYFLNPTYPIKLEITYTPALNSITTYSSVIGVEAANISSINSI